MERRLEHVVEARHSFPNLLEELGSFRQIVFPLGDLNPHHEQCFGLEPRVFSHGLGEAARQCEAGGERYQRQGDLGHHQSGRELRDHVPAASIPALLERFDLIDPELWSAGRCPR